MKEKIKKVIEKALEANLKMSEKICEGQNLTEQEINSMSIVNEGVRICNHIYSILEKIEER